MTAYIIAIMSVSAIIEVDGTPDRSYSRLTKHGELYPAEPTMTLEYTADQVRIVDLTITSDQLVASTAPSDWYPINETIHARFDYLEIRDVVTFHDPPVHELRFFVEDGMLLETWSGLLIPWHHDILNNGWLVNEGETERVPDYAYSWGGVPISSVLAGYHFQAIPVPEPNSLSMLTWLPLALLWLRPRRKRLFLQGLNCFKQ